MFPYSARPGTPAARMPRLSRRECKDRARRLRAKGEKALSRFLEGRVGTWAQVLVEKGATGRSEHAVPVRLEPSSAATGTIVRARITGVAGHMLVGRLAG